MQEQLLSSSQKANSLLLIIIEELQTFCQNYVRTFMEDVILDTHIHKNTYININKYIII